MSVIHVGSARCVGCTLSRWESSNRHQKSVVIIYLLIAVIKLIRKCWLDLLKLCFPAYTFSESTTIRSTIESPRNPGILHFVLKIAGDVDVDVVRAKFDDNILDRRNVNNELIFPRFRENLKRFLGYYAWEANQR